MAEYVPSTAASSSSLTDTTSEGTPVEKWTYDALKTYLKSRGLMYSGLQKSSKVSFNYTFTCKLSLKYTTFLAPPTIFSKLSIIIPMKPFTYLFHTQN